MCIARGFRPRWEGGVLPSLPSFPPVLLGWCGGVGQEGEEEEGDVVVCICVEREGTGRRPSVQ